MKYKDYLGSVEYSPEDNILHGSLAGIVDSVSYHGRSIDELRGAFEEAVDDYIEMCVAEGLEPNKTSKDELLNMIKNNTEKLIKLYA